MEKISIIVPAYNAEKTMDRCLQSLVTQEDSNIEIIIVDDGSKDGTYAIAKKYKKKYENVVLLYQSNQGVSAARNKGIEASTGDYIMFVDSDDSLQSGTCSFLLSEISEEIDLVLFGLNIFRDGKLLRTPHLQNKTIDLDESPEVYWDLRKINLGPCNKLYKKQFIRSLFDLNLSLGEDTKFVLDYMSNINRIKVLQNCLYNVYLDNGNSLNRRFREDKLDQLIAVREYEQQFLLQKYNDVIPELYNQFFLDLHGVLFMIVQRGLSYNVFLSNLMKKEYYKIYEKTLFKKRYYKCFAWLVYKNKAKWIYVLLKLRSFIMVGYCIFKQK